MTDAIIWGDLHIAPINKKAFDAAVANAGLLYQYCAPWGNVAKTVRTIGDLMEQVTESHMMSHQYFEMVTQGQYGQCFIERLAEVIDQKLLDCELQLAKTEFREEAEALFVGMDAEYLRKIMVAAGEMAIAHRLACFAEDCLEEMTSLPSRAYAPMKKPLKFGKPRQYQ